jgi:hypothetical protein
MVHGNVQWKALSESYLAGRPDRVQGRIYIDTGNLMRSFDINSPELIANFEEGMTFNFGTRVAYADKLDSMRSLVFLHDELLEELSETFLEWALEVPENNKLKIEDKK